MALSKEYTMAVNFPVSYVNLPEDKVIANHLPEIINIEIRSSGFNLMMYKLKRRRETILIDIHGSKPLRSKNNFYLYTGDELDKITAQFSNHIRVLEISPDTIFLNFNKKVTKRVPVKANITLYFDHQYQQTDSIQLTPAFIDISGAADVVDKIDHVETVPVNFKNVSKPLTLKLNILISPDIKQVELSQSTVQATINVTKFTEASIELPVEVENLPDGYGLKTFPDKVVIKYNVAFNDYGKINALQFRAVVDYEKIESGNNKLKVHLVKSPAEIRSVKLNPEKVEYIIRK
ncbi:MAG: CdaR family protein [Bacteroidota bacterium]